MSYHFLKAEKGKYHIICCSLSSTPFPTDILSLCGTKFYNIYNSRFEYFIDGDNQCSKCKKTANRLNINVFATALTALENKMKSDIEKNIFYMKQIRNLYEQSQKVECPICLEDIKSEQYILLECGHCIDSLCLRKISKLECQICRNPIKNYTSLLLSL